MRNLCVRLSRLAISVVFLLLSAPLGGWASSSEITGRVLDPSGAVIVEAQVTATNVATNVKQTTTTNEQGIYRFLHLPPGEYNLRVSHAGFRATDVLGIVVHVTQTADVNVTLRLGSVVQTVTVEGGRIFLGKQGAEVGTLVNRQFVENLPLNGRSFHTLIQLTPGVVVTKAVSNPFLSQGQFSVNGQRSSANYFMVDGVSANVGVSVGNSPNQHAVGALPALTAFGGTNNLASVDALEEFRIQTSTYAPEFGRQPGAQISIVTRSGTNDFHGTIFNYFRNDKLDANDWFSNQRGISKAALRQNDFGGVVGGPIIKDKTFFFFSYEGLRLRQPAFMVTEVPSLNARQNAVPAVRPLLDSFPIPNGADLGNEVAEYADNFSEPSYLNATSIRVDHNWGRMTLFGRYNHAPSGIDDRTFGRIHNEIPGRVNTQTLTAGATWIITPDIVNNFRFNWSRVSGDSFGRWVEVGGNVIPPDSAILPSFASTEDSIFGAFIGSIGTIAGSNVNNLQRQINIVDGMTVVKGSHLFKFAVDYRQLFPFWGLRKYDNLYVFTDVPQAMTGVALLGIVNSSFTDITYRVHNLSLYIQDTWRVSPRLTLTYGLRWEANPPPSAEDDKLPFTVLGLDDPSTMTLAPQGTQLWKTTYDNFAPRIGVAYHLSQRAEIVVRGGFGVFYDLGSGTALLGGGSWPYQQQSQQFFVTFPMDDVTAAPLPFSTDPPYGQMYARDPNLKLPYSYQWNVAFEKGLGSNQTLSATYVGAVGRRLIRQEWLRNPFCGCNPDFTLVLATRNGATSDYHALQLQFQRRLSRGLLALVNYSWSHSIDDLSNESFSSIPLEISGVAPESERGSSDFDIRHSFTAAVSYDIPAPGTGRFVQATLGNWSVDSVVRAATGTPINILVGTDALGLGLTGVARPDLVSGVPIWLDDPAVGEGRRINRNAFVIPATPRQGNLSRNALRGFGMWQVDMSVRRRFNFSERFGLQFSVDFFNIFNHPNFGDPTNRLNSGLFGQSTQMLTGSLGSGGLTGGFSPLYNVGGSRSIQLALKFLF